MKMEIGKTYKLVFFLFGKTLTFTGTIISINDFVIFRDKYDVVLNYNKNCLVSYEEVEK